MTDKQAIWQTVLGDMADQFFDLFLSPAPPFPDNVNYPATASMQTLIDDRFDSLVLPEKRLICLGDLIDENWMELDERRLADCVVLFEWEMLQGFGDDFASTLYSASFEGLRRLAEIWGGHLAQVMGRMLRMRELYDTYGELLVAIFRQLTARELGEAVRQSCTPGSLKARAGVEYVLALHFQDGRMRQEAEEVLQASDDDLSHEIEIAMSAMSSIELGNYMKRTATEIATFLRELFSSRYTGAKLADILASGFRGLAFYMGYCFRKQLLYDPERAKRVLEAIGSHKEAAAVMEEYKWLHSWGGSRDRALVLAWEPVARRFFGLSGQIPTVSGNDEQEWEEDQQLKLIGLADGLETYSGKNPAFVGLMDGVSGGLGAYLAKAAKNKETNWYRNQRTEGNRALTEAERPETKDVADKHSLAEGEFEEFSQDEVLSRLKERYHPSGDPTVQEIEAKESSIAWYGSLTEREKTAVNLRYDGYLEEEIATEMGISQQRVSQLLKQALRKSRRIH